MTSKEFENATPHQRVVMEKILDLCEDWESREKGFRKPPEPFAGWEMEAWRFLEKLVAQHHGRYS